MKKFLTLLLTLVCTLVLASCGLFAQGKAAADVEKLDNMIVITVHEAEEGTSLLSVMKGLQEEGKLSFTVDATGMVTGIEGKDNPADWSACWMLYTSDAELSSTEWGTVDYNGKTYGSAMFGANALLVAEGEIYIWSYQTF